RGERGVRVVIGDTLITDVAVLEPDTTPAQLVRVELADSAVLRLVFTDFLDPGAADGTNVSIEPLEGQPSLSVQRVFHPDGWNAYRDSVAAAADSVAGADTTAAGAASRVPLPGQTVAPPEQERGGLPGGAPLPSQ